MKPWFFLKDGKDEAVKMCRNFHGSNAVLDEIITEAARVNFEREKKYNFTMKSDLYTCRKANITHKWLKIISRKLFCLFFSLLSVFLDDEIPVNCQCLMVDNIKCENITKIPKKFPEEVRSF